MYTDRFLSDWPERRETLWVRNNGLPTKSGSEFEQQQALMNYAIEQLPLDEATIVHHPISGELVFEAPDGHAFRIGGNFYTHTESNSFDVAWRPPTPSTPAWKAEGADKEDEDGVYAMYGIKPLDYFEGRYISVGNLSLRPRHTSSWGTDTVWREHYTSRFSSDDKPPRLEVQLISDDYRVVLAPGYGEVSVDEEKKDGTFYSYELEDAFVVWEYEYATADVSELEVDLIAKAPYDQELQVVEGRGNKRIWAPWWCLDRDQMSTMDFAAAMHFAFTGAMHKKSARPGGEGLILVNGGTPDLDMLAKKAIAGQLPIGPQFADYDSKEYMDDQKEQLLRRKRKEMTIIEGTGHISLHDVVQKFSRPDWLESRLAKDIAWIYKDREFLARIYSE